MAIKKSEKPCFLPELLGLYSACTVMFAVAAWADLLDDLLTANSKFPLPISISASFLLLFFLCFFGVSLILKKLKIWKFSKLSKRISKISKNLKNLKNSKFFKIFFYNFSKLSQTLIGVNVVVVSTRFRGSLISTFRRLRRQLLARRLLIVRGSRDSRELRRVLRGRSSFWTPERTGKAIDDCSSFRCLRKGVSSDVERLFRPRIRRIWLGHASSSRKLHF